MELQIIQQKIFEVRGCRVMFQLLLLQVITMRDHLTNKLKHSPAPRKRIGYNVNND